MINELTGQVKPAVVETRSAAEGGGVMAQGCRALHVALRNGHVGAYRSLLKAGADPNAADTEGHTSLMAICNTDRVFSDAQRVVALRELLQAGGDASLADVYGCTAMHFAVCHEDGAALIDLLRSNSPSSLTKPDLRGVTPLRLAALHGWPSSITHLLSLGATQPIDSRHLPLLDAVVGNHASSVRVLLEAGLEAVGGPDALMTAILQSFDLKKSGKVLGLLLAVNGEAEKQRWANTKLEGTPILHMAAALAEVALLSVLLAAGADETAVDPQGISAFAMTGTMVETDGRGKNPAEEAACRRMLERAPAFRAVSWSFPARASDDTDARKRRGRALGVRVFRPRKRTFFLRHVGRREGSDGCLGAVRYAVVLA